MITFNGSIDAIGELDHYYIFLAAGTTYYVELEGSATSQGTLVDPVLTIAPYPYTVIAASDDDGGAGRNARIVFTATQTAWHDFGMYGFGNYTGSYRLSVNGDEFRDTPEGVGAAGALGTGGTTPGAIDFAGDRDVHAVTLVAGQTYHFEMRGSASNQGTLGDTYLELLSDALGAGTVLTSDDDGGIGLDSRIVFTATTSGTYYLRAGEFGNNATGTYRVFAHADEYRDSVEGNGAAGAINTGTSRTASLQVAPDADVWSTTLISGLTYVIAERGAGSGGGTLSDAYLRVLNGSGSQLAADDDSGAGNDAQLTFTATTTGVHFLEAGSFGSSYAGTYTLAVSSGRGTPAADNIVGTAAADSIDGVGGGDTIAGLGGNDFLVGGGGNDTLRGGAQNDVLAGGGAADVLIGGTGGDRFDFNFIGESAPATRDRLRAGDGGLAFDGAGGATGDRIDLAGIDANVTTGANEAFIFGGTGIGRIWLTEAGANTILNANVDNDAAVEFQVAIEDGDVRNFNYAAGDFVL